MLSFTVLLAGLPLIGLSSSSLCVWPSQCPFPQFRTSLGEPKIQYNAPWNLARLTADDVLDNDWDYTYYYHTAWSGSGVRIFILDTGVKIEDPDFEDRASWGANFVKDSDPYGDISGHGTLCASIAIGRIYGVAKNATVVSVKVVNDQGLGNGLFIERGLKYVYDECWEGDHPCVVSMSIGLDKVYPNVDRMVEKLTNAGIHVVVSAGNTGTNARHYSPASAPSAIVVGAMDGEDGGWRYSNFGRVDIWAPGAMISGVRTGIMASDPFFYGTSLAAPQVAGIIACFISKHDNMPPVRMKKLLLKNAKWGQLKHIPFGTPNALAHIPRSITGRNIHWWSRPAKALIETTEVSTTDIPSK